MLACQFLAQGPAEGADAELGGAVHGGHGEGTAPGEGADVDDAGDLTLLFGCCPDQVGNGRVGAVHQAHEVDVDHAPPVVQVRAGGGPQQHEAGVVDQGVQAVQALDGPLDRNRCGLGVGDVAGHDQGDGRAFAGGLQGGGVADTAGGPGDPGRRFLQVLQDDETWVQAFR